MDISKIRGLENDTFIGTLVKTYPAQIGYENEYDCLNIVVRRHHQNCTSFITINTVSFQKSESGNISVEDFISKLIMKEFSSLYYTLQLSEINTDRLS
jgi:hypothetical protein